MSITRNRWTEQDNQNLIQLRAQGYKVKDIAKIMNRTHSSISTKFSMLSNDPDKNLFSPNSGQRYNQNEIAYIVLNHNKFSIKEIAETLGRSYGSISGTISKLKKDGVIIEPRSMTEPKQMEFIAPRKQEIKPPIKKCDDNLNQEIKGLKLDNKWLASLCIINFIGVVIIAVSIL